MTWRKTIAYWAVALLLAVVYFAFERGPAPPPVSEIEREKLLAAFPDEIRTVVLTRDGKDVQAELQEKRWRIVSPKGVSVPADLVAALLETMTEKQQSEIVEDTPTEEDLEAFGLKPPSTVLHVELADGTKTIVEIGHRNPTRTAVYARTNQSPRIMLAGLNIQYYTDLLFQAAYPRGITAPPDAAASAS